MSTLLTPPTTTAAPTPGIRKLNLGALAAKPASSATQYPVLADPTGDIAKLSADILAETAELEGLEGSLDAKKGELRRLAAGQYFPLLHGRGEIPSSLAARTVDGREVLVTFQNRYKAMADESAFTSIIGPALAARFLRQKLTFKVDCDKLPADKLETVYHDLVALFTRHGCVEALSATQGIVPTDDFHTLRHSQLTPEQNATLDLACPIVAMIKTKGRSKK
jgi:hypothetical protein